MVDLVFIPFCSRNPRAYQVQLQITNLFNAPCQQYGSISELIVPVVYFNCCGILQAFTATSFFLLQGKKKEINLFARLNTFYK